MAIKIILKTSTKIGEHIPLCFSRSTIPSFKKKEKIMMYTKVKIAWKSFVNPYESTQWK